MKKTVTSLFKVAEIELVYKRKKKAFEYPVVDTPHVAYEILRSVWDDNKLDIIEQFKIILLDQSLACLGVADISSGGFNHTSADPKIIFSTTLVGRASKIILAHNHTSDNLSPSKADLKATSRLVACAEILDIEIADHIILNRRDFISMKALELL